MVEKAMLPTAATTTTARATEPKSRCSFVVYGRLILALLAFTSVLVGQIPTRVYFPFEQSVLPSPGALKRLEIVTNTPNTTAKSGTPARAEELARARTKLRRARIEALADVLVTRYVKWHRKNRELARVRKLIWVGSGNKYGFGDRFRGIIHAYLCAVVTGRILIIKWDEPFSLSTIFESSNIDIFWNSRIDGEEFKLCDKGVAVKGGKCKLVNETTLYEQTLPFGGLPHCYCSLNKLNLLESDLPSVVLRSEMAPNIRRLFESVLKSSRKLPPFATPLLKLAKTWKMNTTSKFGKTFGPNMVDDAKLFALIFKSMLKPSNEFLKMLSKQNSQVQSFIPRRLKARHTSKTEMKHVSIHARLGIGLGEKTKYYSRFGNVTSELMAACMAGHAAEEADKLDLPEPQRFYLATDTSEFVKPFKYWLQSRSKNAIIVEGVGANDKVHSNTLEKGKEKDRERFLLTAKDLFFLAAGDSLISLPSGFSNLASWFSGRHHVIISYQQCLRENWLQRPIEYNVK